MNLIGSGRAADVFEYGPSLVLRRYRTERDVTTEAAVMSHLRREGFPVPEVVEAGGRDLVMERVGGPSMLSYLADHPWSLGRHAGLLADLHRWLHSIAPPPHLAASLSSPYGQGASVIHGDLHPGNVLLSDSGPVVIDWSNAALASGAFDVAMSWVLIATSDVLGTRATRVMAACARGSFVRRFLRNVDDEERQQALARLPLAAAARLAAPNVTATERAAVERLLSRSGKRGSLAGVLASLRRHPGSVSAR